jgi:hypothetical protein
MERLTVRVARLNEHIGSLQTWQQNATSDMETISDKFIREADQRGWCSDYDRIISDLNSQISVLEFKQRSRSVNGTVEGTITINFSISVEGVEVGSGEDADDAVRDYFSENYDYDDIRRSRLDWSDAEIEVTDVSLD